MRSRRGSNPFALVKICDEADRDPVVGSHGETGAGGAADEGGVSDLEMMCRIEAIASRARQL